MVTDINNKSLCNGLKAGVILIILLFFTQAGCAQDYWPATIDISANPTTISRSSFSTITVVATGAGGICSSGVYANGVVSGGTLIPPVGGFDSTNSFTAKFNSSISGIFTITFFIPPQPWGSNFICSPVPNSVNVTVINDPPKTPAQPSGPASGSIGTSYTYTTSTTDPNNDQIKYTFDWGDNSKNTTNFLDSGATAGASHVWSNPGIYNIKVSALDAEGPASGWSTFTTVNIESTSLLSVSPDPLSFNLDTMNAGGTSSQVFSIKNAGGGTLTWAVSKDQAWMTMNPTSGTNSGDVILSINTAGLSPGSHSGTINVTSNGGTKKGIVSLNIAEPAPQPGVTTPGVTTPGVTTPGVTTPGVTTPTGQNIFKVTLSSDPASVEPGQTSTIIVTVTGSNGTVIPGTSVMMDSIPAGKFDPASGTTNAFGRFNSTFTAPAKGNATVEALVKKEGFADGGGKLELAAPQPVIPLYYIFILLLVAISAGLLYFLYLKKRKKEVNEKKPDKKNDNKFCMYCKDPLPLNAEFCLKCGKKQEEKKRFCMNCGAQMPAAADLCPRCGKMPPSDVDTKTCKNCGEVIPAVANFCSACGAGQPG